MIDEFIVYVIVDNDNNEYDRYFHCNDALKTLEYYKRHYPNKKFSIIQRLVVYSE